LLVQGNGSKATEKAIGAFKDAKAKHDGKIKFFMINPYGTESRSAVQAELDKYATDIPVLMDDTQLVSEALAIKKTGEVILLRPPRRRSRIEVRLANTSSAQWNSC
jgi:hypothetical protein